MLYEIYIDSIFLMNFIMNIYLLSLTARTLGRTATRLRIAAVSTIGAAAFCLILIVPYISYSYKILIGLIPVSIGMVKLTFQTRGIKNILRETGYLFVYAFLLGGFMLFILKRFAFLRNNSGKMWCVLGIGYLSYSLSTYFLARYKSKKMNSFCTVTIPCNEHKVKVTALIDTGNGLVEPISKKPASLLEESVWEQLQPLKREDKLKVIPYHSIGKSHGIMEGYELEAITIEKEGVQVNCEKVIICICKGQISAGNKYQMILHPGLLDNM